MLEGKSGRDNTPESLVSDPQVKPFVMVFATSSLYGLVRRSSKQAFGKQLSIDNAYANRQDFDYVMLVDTSVCANVVRGDHDSFQIASAGDCCTLDCS